MEVNSGISTLMREWLTEEIDRGKGEGTGERKKAKAFASSVNVFQPRPER